MDKDQCLELWDEYRLLEDKIRVAMVGDITPGGYSERVAIEQEDLDRLAELRMILKNQCLPFLPEDEIKKLEENDGGH